MVCLKFCLNDHDNHPKDQLPKTPKLGGFSKCISSASAWGKCSSLIIENMYSTVFFKLRYFDAIFLERRLLS